MKVTSIVIIVIASMMIASNFVDWFGPSATFFESILMFTIACLNTELAVFNAGTKLDQ